MLINGLTTDGLSRDFMPTTLLRILIAGMAGAVLGGVHQFAPFTGWEDATVDLRLQLRPKTVAPGAIGIVAVGDKDVEYEQFGGWPFKRSVHADVITILRAFGASHLTFDVIFSDPGETEHDEALARTLAERDDFTLAYHFEDLHFPEKLDQTGGKHFAEGKRYGVDVRSSPALVGINPRELIFQTPAVAAVNVRPDANDSVIRRVPLFVQNNGMLYPGLAMQTLIRYLELEPDQIRIVPGKKISLVDTAAGTLEIPIDERLQYRINYTSEINDFDPAFQYLDLYLAVEDTGSGAANLIKEAVSGKPVIIGNVSTGSSDVVTTPIGRLPGMLAQATAINNILTGNHLRFVPTWIQIMGLALAGILLGLILRMSSPPGIVLTSIFLAGAWLTGAWFLARNDWMIPVLPFLELITLAMVGSLWYQIRLARDETGRTLKALRKYVSPSVAERALREEAFLKIQNERREITVFFSDIRGFTNWSEKKEPEEITLVLNEYLGAMTTIVSEYGGTLDKFVGDCVMVLFNTPNKIENHPIRAVEMAIAMQSKIEDLSKAWRAMGRDPIEVGTGIHTGFATVGNFGSETYSDYTAIGNCVNLAARIESVSGAGEILVSETTRRRVGDTFSTKEKGEFELKGISEKVKVFEVVQAEPG